MTALHILSQDFAKEDARLQAYNTVSYWSEWVSSFLMADQHILGDLEYLTMVWQIYIKGYLAAT